MDKKEFIASKITKLMAEGYTRSQSIAIAYNMAEKEVAQQGSGMTNGYSNNQKQISRVLRNVETNEVKEGSLPPGYYTRVDYSDGSFDYIKKGNEDMLQKIPNYIDYMTKMSKNNSQEMSLGAPIAKAQQGRPFDVGALNLMPEYVPPTQPTQNQVVAPTQPAPTQGYNPNVDPFVTPRLDWGTTPNNNQNSNVTPQTPLGSITNNYVTPHIPKATSGEQVVKRLDAGSPIQPIEVKGRDYMQEVQDSAEKALTSLETTQQPNQEGNEDYAPNRVNIINPDGGLSLDYALNYAGRGFGAKNALQATLGTGLSVVKGARNFLTGYSEGKENSRVANEMTNKQFERPRNYVYGQSGGKVKNSNIIAQNAIVDEGQGNINMEGNEVVLRNNGQVQPVVGEPHIKNGKVADGVNATLNEGDKVISDYVKLKPTDIKDLKERYDVALKKGATFAQAQKKIDQKLGIKKLEDEKATVLEKLEKAGNIEDKDTKELSENALLKSYASINEKLGTLQGIRAEAADFIFERQERQPKKGSPGDLFDKNGKLVEETNYNTKQQGGIIKLTNIEKEYLKEIKKLRGLK